MSDKSAPAFTQFGVTTEPAPAFAAIDVADLRLIDAELFSDLALEHLAAKRADFEHVRFVELGRAASFAAIVRAVEQSVLMVLSVCRPTHMPRIAATLVALAARVRRLVFRRRRRTMDSFASKAVNKLHTSILPNMAVAAAASGIRPDQTFDLDKRKDDLAKVSLRFAARRSPGQRIAVTTPAPVMGATPSTRIVWLAATFDRAYSGISHFDLRDRLAWLERATRQAPSGAFVFCSRSKPQEQGA